MTSAGYGSTASQAQAVSLVRSYTNDAANRLTGWNYAVNVNSASFPVQTDTYTYDNNGNRLTKQAVLTGQSSTPQQTNYSYDFENRLNQLQYTNIPNITGTQTDYLFYNGEGLRTQANIANVFSGYFYDGSNILVEQDVSGNTTKTYTRAVGFPGGINGLITQNYTVSGTPTVQYYGYDDLGSTANLTTSAGATATSYSYDAYGNLLTTPASSDTNRYFFSTKEFDARSGLDYFGARYYDPEIGRWLTQDPLGFVNGMNNFIYVNNNPVNFIDPYGLDDEQFGVPFIVGMPPIQNIYNSGSSGGFQMPQMNNPFNGNGDGWQGGGSDDQLPDFGPISPGLPIPPPNGGNCSAEREPCTDENNQNQNGDMFNQSGDENNPTTTNGTPFSELQAFVEEPWYPENYNKDWVNNAPKGGSFWEFLWWGVGQFFRVFHPH